MLPLTWLMRRKAVSARHNISKDPCSPQSVLGCGVVPPGGWGPCWSSLPQVLERTRGRAEHTASELGWASVSFPEEEE